MGKNAKIGKIIDLSKQMKNGTYKPLSTQRCDRPMRRRIYENLCPTGGCPRCFACIVVTENQEEHLYK